MSASLPAEGVPAGPTGPITLDVVVTDGKSGKPVPGLAQGSFSLFDRGTPRELTGFRALDAKADPARVLIVVDAVNLDYTRLAYERSEIKRFLKANEGRLAQPTALAIVTDTGTFTQGGYTTDGNALDADFEKQEIGLRVLRRSAGFYGAAERLDISLRAFNQLLARADTEPGRKFLIWMTPGWPLLSGPRVDYTSKQQQALFAQVVALSDSLRRSRTVLYTVDPIGSGENVGRTFYFEDYVKGVTKPSDAYPADLGAQVLAIQSGGQFLSGSNDLAGLLQRCYDDASAGYAVTFVPPPAEQPNEYHTVEVRLDERHLVAHTRTGYYDQP